VVIGSRRGNMICSFFGEDRRELRVFGGKDSFGFCGFCGSGEFSSGSEAGNYWGSHRNKAGTTSDDSMEGSVFASSVDMGRFFLPLVVLEEMRISDGIHVDVVRRASGGFKEGVVPLVVDFVGGEEELGFIDRFVDGEGSGSPIDDWVGGSQPGKS